MIRFLRFTLVALLAVSAACGAQATSTDSGGLAVLSIPPRGVGSCTETRRASLRGPAFSFTIDTLNTRRTIQLTRDSVARRTVFSEMDYRPAARLQGMHLITAISDSSGKIIAFEKDFIGGQASPSVSRFLAPAELNKLPPLMKWIAVRCGAQAKLPPTKDDE